MIGGKAAPGYSPAMRPDRLNTLFAESAGLKGVGPQLAKPLEKLGLTRVKDIAYHLPERFVQRRAVADLDEAGIGENIVIALTVREHRAPTGRGPFRALAEDARGNYCALTFFGRAVYSAKKLLPVGAKRWVAGRLDQYGQMPQIVHPDHIGEEGAAMLGQLCEPVYALSEGLTQNRVAPAANGCLWAYPSSVDWFAVFGWNYTGYQAGTATPYLQNWNQPPMIQPKIDPVPTAGAAVDPELCDASRASTGHASCVAAMADGSVRLISPAVSQPTWQAAILAEDGIPLGSDL